jgi:hypothetical protein
MVTSAIHQAQEGRSLHTLSFPTDVGRALTLRKRFPIFERLLELLNTPTFIPRIIHRQIGGQPEDSAPEFGTGVRFGSDDLGYEAVDALSRPFV